ncbi:hypothetical protein AB0H00_22335 [Nocardia sp. NPDC023852]
MFFEQDGEELGRYQPVQFSRLLSPLQPELDVNTRLRGTAG